MSGIKMPTFPCFTSSLAMGVPKRMLEYSGIQRPTFAYKCKFGVNSYAKWAMKLCCANEPSEPPIKLTEYV